MDNNLAWQGIILYLDELGFDFEENSALDLLRAIKDITQIAQRGKTVRDSIMKYCMELDELNKELMKRNFS